MIESLSRKLNLKQSQIETVLSLLEDGNTVPFIARYRKEMTGSLDEEQIREIDTEYQKAANLQKRKEEVLRLIEERATLTPELQKEIEDATTLKQVEELFLPYKEKKKTRATEAIRKGLAPLAELLMSKDANLARATEFLNDEVKSVEEALSGASDIVAEQVSDSAKNREILREAILKYAMIETKVKKKHDDEKAVYQNYYDYSEKFSHLPNHRVMAINRAESEKVINRKFTADFERTYAYIVRKNMTKSFDSNVQAWCEKAVLDGIDRLMLPSLTREAWSERFESAATSSIQTFQTNLEQLLMGQPLKQKVVLGVDPAYRTGCKWAVVNEFSKPLEIGVIYPHQPKNQWNEAIAKLESIVKKYKVEIIAIGNGTASRETERLISELITTKNLPCQFIIVNESGASVYSASPLAIREFPDLAVEERSAISIARRLQDPMSEFVKIDPESIGVGQYQHDVKQADLKESLTFTVEKIVNQVGVNLNNASSALLQYVSGLNKTIAENIVKFREENGNFTKREMLKKVPRLGPKAYEQAVGFLRILEGVNPLDKTSIHPESYKATEALLKELGVKKDQIGTEEIKTKLAEINVEELATKLNIGLETLQDIVSSLKEPLRDPRDSVAAPLLKSEILSLENVQVGMELEGAVRNMTDFGVFVDIGIKNDGLVHISKLSKKFIKHPSDVVKVGDIVKVTVIEIDEKRGRLSLSMVE